MTMIRQFNPWGPLFNELQQWHQDGLLDEAPLIHEDILIHMVKVLQVIRENLRDDE